MTRKNLVCIFLSALTILNAGIAIGSVDVSGTWKICGFDADKMVLTQVGTHVYGTYSTSQGKGTIDGTINAQKVWLGTWNEPFNDDYGYFSVIFSNDTSYMYGSWKYAEGDYDSYDVYAPYSGDWDGNFQGAKIGAGNSTAIA